MTPLRMSKAASQYIKRDAKPCRSLFVYGTLRLDMEPVIVPTLIELLKKGRLVGRASMMGRMHDLGNFPAVKPSSFHSIIGQLISFDNLKKSLWTNVIKAIDTYEGTPNLYERRHVVVVMENGIAREAFAYFYQNPCSQMPLVEGGDWVQHIHSLPNPLAAPW